MQWDYVYADLQVKVTFDADAGSPFFNITDSEVKALQQLVYHGLMIFSNIRTCMFAEAAELFRQDKAALEDEKRLDNGG